jgi:hypothetical protein
MFTFTESIDGINLFPRRRHRSFPTVGGLSWHMSADDSRDGNRRDAGLIVGEEAEISRLAESLREMRDARGMISEIRIIRV